MFSEIKIIIPSKNRAETFTTNIDNQILFVEYSELDEYRKRNVCEVVGHEKFKNLAQKRNFILKKFGSVFMVDDDVLQFVDVQGVKPRHERNLSSQKIYSHIQELYKIAIETGSILFGFSGSPVPMQFNSLKPIGFNINMCGGAYGIRKGDLYFNEQTTACDSHFIQLLNLVKYGYNLVDRRIGVEFQETFYTSGGQSSKRTIDTEKRDTLFLKKTFGKLVELRKASRNKKNNSYQRVINYGKM